MTSRDQSQSGPGAILATRVNEDERDHLARLARAADRTPSREAARLTGYRDCRKSDTNLVTLASLAGVVVDALPEEFPHFVIEGPNFGQWWRIHRRREDGGTAWWFASLDEGRVDPGRFDLARPFGTCYVASFDDAAGAEAAPPPAGDDAETQRAWNALLLSQMPLDRWFGARMADFTSDGVVAFGAPRDIGVVDRNEARPWALRAHEGGYRGLHFRLGKDPQRRPGIALFGCLGDHPPPFTPSPQPLPVGARNALRAIFGVAPPEDPLAV